MATEWKKVKLNEICSSITDGDHLPPPKAETGIPFVTISNIQNNQLSFENTMFVPESYYEKLDNKRKAQKNDILYSVVGSFGIPVFIKNNTPFVFQRHIAILRPSTVEPRFLFYSMLSKDFYAKADAAAIGAAQRTVSLSSLRNIEINIPPLETQHKIAGILSAYDDLIENNRKQIKLLEEAAQKLYKEWFVKLNFPGHENTKIVDGVPEGWKKVSAEDYFEITIGKTPPRNETKWFSKTNGVKWISIADMGNSDAFILETTERLTNEAVESKNVKVIPANTVLLSFKLTVGRVSIATEEMTTNEAIAHFGTDKIFIREYLYLYLKNFHYDSLGSTSAISTAINSKIVKAMPIIIPTETVLEKFSNILKPYFDKILNCQKSIQDLQSARDKLLPKLMNGELITN